MFRLCFGFEQVIAKPANLWYNKTTDRSKAALASKIQPFCGCFSYIWLLFAADGVFRSHQMLEGDFFYGGESLLQDMTARVLQRRKRTVTLMARPVYDAAAALRAGSFGIGQINA